MTGTCDICKRDFEYHTEHVGGFTVAFLSSHIRIERRLDGKLEIHTCKVCEACATRVINYINALQDGTIK